MQSNDVPIPNWPLRFRALAHYLGWAPIASLFARPSVCPFLVHHRRQAMGIFLLLGLVVIVFVLAIVFLSYGMIFQRPFYDRTHPEGITLNITRKLFLCWVVFWAYGGALALLGSRLEMPLVSLLGRSKWPVRLGAGLMLVFYAVLAVGVPVGVHASSLTRQDAAPGKAYMLYENVDRFPRWMFTLAFYRISLAATERWGQGSVVVLRLSEDTLKRALAEANFVFIGSHGMKQGLLLKKGFIRPEDIRKMGVNPGLRFVYLTSCDSGAQKDTWEQVFSPARVVTYDRLTTVLEHFWWLLFEGPQVVRTLPG